MGAWAAGTFGNDTACDWAEDFAAHAKDLAVVTTAIEEVFVDDYLDGDIASEALAACEVLARLAGRWGIRDVYSESLDSWVEQHPQTPPPALVTRALAAIDRITAADSELAELWAGEAEWTNAVADLRKRVAG